MVIGVALISGTLIFSDTINKSFDEIGESSYSGVAAVVTVRGLSDLRVLLDSAETEIVSEEIE